MQLPSRRLAWTVYASVHLPDILVQAIGSQREAHGKHRRLWEELSDLLYRLVDVRGVRLAEDARGCERDISATPAKGGPVETPEQTRVGALWLVILLRGLVPRDLCADIAGRKRFMRSPVIESNSPPSQLVEGQAHPLHKAVVRVSCTQTCFIIEVCSRLPGSESVGGL